MASAVATAKIHDIEKQATQPVVVKHHKKNHDSKKTHKLAAKVHKDVKKAEKTSAKKDAKPEETESAKVKVLHTLFQTANPEHGKLSFDDATQVLKTYSSAYQFEITNDDWKQMEELYEGPDLIGGNTLSFNQVAFFAHQFETEANLKEHQKKVFDEVDTNHSGSLDLEQAEAAIDIWAKSMGIKISPQGLKDMIGIYEDTAGKSGSLSKEKYVDFALDVKKKINRRHWKQELPKIYHGMDALDLDDISYPDARIALEAWANENGVDYDDDDLKLGREIEYTYEKQHGGSDEIDYDEFEDIAPKILGADHGKLQGDNSVPLAPE